MPDDDVGHSSATDALLDVDRLSVRFPVRRGQLHAVDDVSMSVGAGEAVAIVGESGSGKSVLARAIMRLTPESGSVRGSIVFDGQDLLSLPPKKAKRFWGSNIAMVFQNPMTSLNPVLRVGRLVGEPLRQHLGLEGAALRDRVVEILRLAGIPEPERRMRAHPHELSGGMRQRIGIAMAIACEPRLLLADEPTTALDVTVQHQILELLGDLRERNGMSLVLITHDLAIATRRTDRTVVMYGGRVMEAGPTTRLFSQPRHPYTVALLKAAPRLEDPSHTLLHTISGSPADVVDPKPGCRFAGRCERADNRCRKETPVLTATDDAAEHLFACFHPYAPGEAGTASLKGTSHVPVPEVPQ